jgi:hypothetical protein
LVIHRGAVTRVGFVYVIANAAPHCPFVDRSVAAYADADGDVLATHASGV